MTGSGSSQEMNAPEKANRQKDRYMDILRMAISFMFSKENE